MNVCKDNCLAECIQCEPMKLKQVYEWLVQASGEMYPFPLGGGPSTIQVRYINEYKSIS